MPSKKISLSILSLIIFSIFLYFYGTATFLKAQQLYFENSANLVSRNIKFNDKEIYFYDSKEYNNNSETILLLHGFGQDKTAWLETVHQLNQFKSYRFILPEMIGHGESSQGEEIDYLPENQAIVLKELMAQLSIQNYHVMGLSMGGWIAGILAHMDQQRILSLGLVSSAGLQTPTESTLNSSIKQATGLTSYAEGLTQTSPIEIIDTDWKNPLLVMDIDDVDSLMAFLLAEPPKIPSFVKRHLANIMSDKLEIKQQVFIQLLNGKVTLEPLLSQLEMPVFLAWGEHDQVSHFSAIEHIESLVGQSSSHLYKHSGHAPHLEEAELFTQNYLAFLKAR